MLHIICILYVTQFVKEELSSGFIAFNLSCFWNCKSLVLFF